MKILRFTSTRDEKGFLQRKDTNIFLSATVSFLKEKLPHFFPPAARRLNFLNDYPQYVLSSSAFR
jgi:hypothetical protein